jgi:hypothetical protein
MLGQHGYEVWMMYKGMTAIRQWTAKSERAKKLDESLTSVVSDERQRQRS